MSFAIAGFLTGIIGGLFGVGGGEIFIPLLIYLFGFSQHQAQGTSLAVLLPPIGLLAALRYYRAGHVDFAVAGLLALGFLLRRVDRCHPRDQDRGTHPEKGIRGVSLSRFASHDVQPSRAVAQATTARSLLSSTPPTPPPTRHADGDVPDAGQ